MSSEDKPMFNEETLKEEIIKKWGEHGAHMVVYNELLKRAKANEPLISDEKPKKKLIIVILPIGNMPTQKAREYIANTEHQFREESIQDQFDIVVLPEKQHSANEIRIEAFVSDDEVSTVDLIGLKEMIERIDYLDGSGEFDVTGWTRNGVAIDGIHSINVEIKRGDD